METERFQSIRCRDGKPTRDGYCIAVDTDDDTWEGIFQDGQPDGRINIRYKDGGIGWYTYIKGVLTGPGIEILGDGSRYEGDYVNGDMRGYGQYTFPVNPEFNKASVYRGYWINCKRDGPGIQLNANGSIDQGIWREDELVDKMKLDPDHDKQVDAALSRAEAVRACTEIGKMLKLGPIFEKNISSSLAEIDFEREVDRLFQKLMKRCSRL